MVRRKDRTQRVVKKQVVTPGHKRVVHLKRKAHRDVHRCAVCGGVMHGVRSNGSKSEKTPSRVFGGHLCHACTTRIITWAARVKDGAKALSDVPLHLRDYVSVMLKRQ